MQVISAPQAYQFLARLYKEYRPVKQPLLLLVRFQFDLVMGEGIAVQEFQQLPLQFLLAQAAAGI